MRVRLLSICGAIISLVIFLPSSLEAQGTAFTYQGQLYANGGTANGIYNFVFSLYTTNTAGTAVAGPVTNNAVFVTNGLFTVAINFGSSVWNGQTNWLQIGVESNTTSPFTTLSPREQVTPTPYAITAESLPGLAVQGNTNGSPNLIGGSSLNYVSSGTIGATIGGGGAVNFGGAAYSNSVTGDFGTVGGGVGNLAGASGAFVGGGGYDGTTYQGNQTFGNASVIAGGLDNSINSGSAYAAVLSGQGNRIDVNSPNSAITAGELNSIGEGTDHSFIGGGLANGILLFSGTSDTIGGGENNGMSGSSISDSVISGGNGNQIRGNADFIGGGELNDVTNDYSAIGGGTNNSVQADLSFVGGGRNHVVSGFASAVVSGEGNSASANDTFVGGGWGNSAQDNDTVVAGGDNNQAQVMASAILGGEQNIASEDHTTVGGGQGNNAGGSYGFIGGGQGNTANGAGDVIGGGYNNGTVNENNSTIGGGSYNNSAGSDSFIGGGSYNSIGGVNAVIDGGVTNSALDDISFVGGGSNNVSGGYASEIPGGMNNSALGNYSFAAGNNAQATNNGAFVWSDGMGTTTTSFTNNQFMARASGGVVFLTGTAASPTSYATGSAGVALLPGATAWSTVSDRNAKKNFEPVDTVALLDKLAAVPIMQWNYKWEKNSDVPNIGPMAQDFKRAFYPGRDDKSISTLEFDGVELAAIQGLNQKLETQAKEKDAEIAGLKEQNDLLAKQLNELANAVKILQQKNQ